MAWVRYNALQPTMKKPLLLVALTLTLLACATLFPSAKSTPVPPLPTSTIWPTVLAEPSPTFTPQPTLTTTPTAWSSPTPLPFALTYVLSSPYPTATVQAEFDCQLIWQSPGNGITYEPGTSFATGWKVTNTGTLPWDPGSVDFVYLSGAKLHDEPLVPLKARVAPGQSVILSVAMTAPKNSTSYVTRWSLRNGDTLFCPLSVSIYVQ